MTNETENSGNWGWGCRGHRRWRFFIPVIVVGAIALFGYITMSLWNWVMPDIFGLHMITFWQAVGILILSKILFGGFRGRGGRCGCGGGWRGRRHMYWKEKWANMSEEEKAKFKEEWKNRC